MMDDFIQTAIDLGMDEVPVSLCEEILHGSCSQELDEIVQNNCIFQVQTILAEGVFENNHSTIEFNTSQLLKRIATGLIHIVNRSKSSEEVLAAASSLLHVCTISGSSAFGILNTNVLSTITASFLRVTIHEIQCLSSNVSKSNKGSGGPSNTSKKSKKPSNRNDISQDDCNSESESGDEEVELSQQLSQQSSRSRSATQECSQNSQSRGNDMAQMSSQDSTGQQIHDRACVQSILRLLQDLTKHRGLYTEHGDNSVLDGFAETLVGVLCLSAVSMEFSVASQLTSDALVQFCSSRSTEPETALTRQCVSSVFRTLLNPLLMASHDPRVPSHSRHRTACHKAAADVLIRLARDYRASVQLKTKIDQCVRLNTTCNTLGQTTRTSTSSQSTTPALPCGINCILSSLQRLVMHCSERAPVRALATSSVLSILTALVQMPECVADGNVVSIPDQRRKQPAKSRTAKARKEIEHQPIHNDNNNDVTQEAMSIFLNFVIRLSRSNKVSLRTFSLDIISSLLTSHWTWNMPYFSDTRPEGEGASGTVNPSPELLELFIVVEGRCRDSVATVRQRAIAIVCELLLTASASMRNDELSASGLLQKVLFSRLYSHREGDESNLWALLQDRVEDEKAMVRGKALQALTAATSLRDFAASNPSNSDHTSDPILMSELISDDIIYLIADRCADTSTAVRKQALNSISELLLARPSDALLQQVWVTAALPLCLDSEATVQNRLAQFTFQLIVEGAVMWAESSTSTSSQIHDRKMSGESSYATVAGLGCHPAWGICLQIQLMQRTKMLQSCLRAMLRDGILQSEKRSKSSSSTVTIERLVCAIKKACTSKEEGCIREEATAAWILLDAILSQKPDNGPGLDVLRTLSTNSDIAVFVIQSFYASSENIALDLELECDVSDSKLSFANVECGGKRGASLLDDNSVRMLRVLSRVVTRISAEDRAKLVPLLLAMQLQFSLSHEASTAVIHLLFALSKSTTDSLEYSSLRIWVMPLLSAVHSVLHKFIWFELPDNSQFYQLSSEDLRRIELACSRCESTRRRSGSSVFSDSMESDSESSVVCNALFLLGELAMLGFTLDEEDCDATNICGESPQEGCLQPGRSPKDSCAIRSFFRLHISSEIVTLAQLLMAQRLPSEYNKTSSGNRLSGSMFGDISRLSADDSSVLDNLARQSFPLLGMPCPPVVRAMAFLAVGKLCMRDRQMAKLHVNVFLRELRTDNGNSNGSKSKAASASRTSISSRDSLSYATNEAVRSNSLLILGDMCVRYTNLVDRHLNILGACLQDPSILIRRHAFVLLMQLLMQDYVKWRGILLFRFLAMTVDPNPDLADFVQFTLLKTLHAKFPLIFVQHLADAVVILNECKAHPAYTAALTAGGDGDLQSSVSGTGIGLAMTSCRTLRFEVYEFMAKTFTEEQKISATAKLVQDVLNFALDVLDQSRESGSAAGRRGSRRCDDLSIEEMIFDTFSLLSSPLLCVDSKADKGGTARLPTDMEEEEKEDVENTVGNGNEKALIAKAKLKVLRKLSLQHLVGHILPVVCSLKVVLEKRRSPLQSMLMQYLVSLVKQHKAEVSVVLEGDPVLRAELEYDMKAFERNGGVCIHAVPAANVEAKRRGNQSRRRVDEDKSCASPPRARMKKSPPGSVFSAPSLKKAGRGDAVSVSVSGLGAVSSSSGSVRVPLQSLPVTGAVADTGAGSLRVGVGTARRRNR